MSLSYTEAVDQMVALFHDLWSVDTAALPGRSSPVLVQWPGEPEKAPSVVQPFARWNQRHIANPRHTFGPTGSRRYERAGLITVQCFGPIADQNISTGGLSLAENLAIIARNAYEGEGTAEGLWFRNARIVPIGPDGVYYQVQALVDFVYDECR